MHLTENIRESGLVKKADNSKPDAFVVGNYSTTTT